MSELHRAFFMKPHPVPSAQKRGVAKKDTKPRTDAATVYGNVMRGQGPLSLAQITWMFNGKKSRLAVYNCLRNTLAPKGLVRPGYKVYKGGVKEVTYEWTGD